MRYLITILSFLFIFTGCSSKISPDEEASVVEAARAWLSLVDENKYEASWTACAAFLKKEVEKKRWVDTLTEIRKPKGALVSRQVTSTEYRTDLPNAVLGKYLIIKFKTSFANQPAAVESITQMREKDGIWRVVGYQLN